jgi:hypothetical protein
VNQRAHHGKRIEDLRGQRFGRLVPQEFVRRYRGQTLWRCRCDCGAVHVTRAGALKSGRAQSCGCSVAAQDLTGRVFGRLVVLEQGERGAAGLVCWRVRCACGQEAVVNGCNLRSGNTRSCGCLRRETSAAVLARLRGDLSERHEQRCTPSVVPGGVLDQIAHAAAG